MAEEIELKFRLHDPAILRRRLQDAGAERVDRVTELNRLLDTPDRDLQRHDCGLRVREIRAAERSASFTFKGPRAGGEFKQRTELETAVDDAHALLEILRRLGYRETVVFEKRRESWRLGGCEVMLDELPRLGWWLEIEGPSTEAVREMRRALGMSESSVVAETYVELAARHGDEDEDGCRHLLFEGHD